MEIEVDLAKAQRYGLRPGDVRRETSTLISGLTVGNLYEQQKVFDVVVWGGQATRQNIGSLESLLIDTPSGGHVRLGDVADGPGGAQPGVHLPRRRLAQHRRDGDGRATGTPPTSPRR